jgi:ATP-binding cassette subfamily F protein uup
MDRVVTSLLVIDEQGHVEEQAGNFSDWEARGGALLSTVDESRLAAKAVKTSVPAAVLASEGKAQVKKKLNYKEQRELDTLPDLIAGLETQQATLEEATSSADFYAQDQAQVKAVLAELTRVSESLDAALDRLVALED